MEQGNTRTVWVVYADKRKNMSAAEKFGELKDVFSSVPRTYNSDKLIEHARRVLSNWQNGDYLLMVGDPVLCGICISVALEFDEYEEVNVLRWDRDNFEYTPLRLNFSLIEEDLPT